MMFWSAYVRILITDFQQMLIHMITVRMMQITAMEVIDEIGMLDGNVVTVSAVCMIMFCVMYFVAVGHY